MANVTEPLRKSYTQAQVGATAGFDQTGSYIDLEPDPITFVDGQGRTFHIDAADAIGHGGYAVVLRARCDEDGKDYAAKVSAVDSNIRHEGTYEKVLKTLKGITDDASNGGYARTHLMPLVAYGTVEARPLGGGAARTYNVSIMPVCSQLDSRHVSVEELKSRFIPDIAEALHVLHEHGIIHRDVKPSNVFVYNGALVLGDFNISSVMGEGQSLGYTTEQRMTRGYSPSNGVVSASGDWYAFGYTVWTLYNGGKHPHQYLIDADGGAGLSAVYAGRRPVEFVPRSSEDKSLRSLIYGLTWVIGDQSFGYEDVRRWIEKPETVTWSDPGVGTGWTYKIKGTSCSTDEELARALAQNWDEAKKRLFRHELAKFFREKNETDISAMLAGIADDYGDLKRQDLGLAMAIYLLSGDAHLMFWKGIDVSLSALFYALSLRKTNGGMPWGELFASGFLSWACGCSGLPEAGELACVMGDVEAAAKVDLDLALGMMEHKFDCAGGRFASCRSADDLFDACTTTPFSFYQVVDTKDRYTELLAASFRFVRADALLDLYRRRLEEISQSESAAILPCADRTLMLFEKMGAKSEAVCDFYRRCGSIAPWLWTEENLRLYRDVPQRQAEALEDAARHARDKTNVAELMGCEAGLRDAVMALRGRLDDFPLISYYGIETGRGSSALEDDGLFCGKLYGETVPRGFARGLLLASKADMEDPARWPAVRLAATDGDAQVQEFDRRVQECVKSVSFSEGYEDKLAVSALMLLVAVPLALFAAPWIYTWSYGLLPTLDVVVLKGMLVAALCSMVVYAVFAVVAYASAVRFTGRLMKARTQIRRMGDEYRQAAAQYVESAESPFRMRLSNPEESLPIKSAGYDAKLKKVGKEVSLPSVEGSAVGRAMWVLTSAMPMGVCAMLAVAGLASTFVIVSGEEMVTYALLAFSLALVGWLLLWLSPFRDKYCTPFWWVGACLAPAVFVFALYLIVTVLTVAFWLVVVFVCFGIVVAMVSSNGRH